MINKIRVFSTAYKTKTNLAGKVDYSVRKPALTFELSNQEFFRSLIGAEKRKCEIYTYKCPDEFHCFNNP